MTNICKNIKVRQFKDKNYRAVFFDNQTMRFTLDATKPIKELEYPEFYDIKVTNKCNGNCVYCLTEDMKIKTKDGDKDIKDITENDFVYTLNLRTNEVELQQVSQLFKREYNGELIQLELDNGNIINITPNHKVFTQNRGFIRADELTTNDNLLGI